MSALAALLRSARFRLWARLLAARLGRLGVKVRVEAREVPRFFTLPRLEPVVAGDGAQRPGTLTIRLGRGVKLGRDLILEVAAGADNLLEIGDRTTFEAFCRVQLHGGEIHLGRGVHVRDLVLLKTKSRLAVGDRTVLSRGVNVHATTGVEIGAECGIGERTSIIDSDHTADGSPEYHLDRPLKLAPVRVGRNVAVSANTVILRDTTIGDNSVVAANAVLNGGEFPAGHLIGGVPATALRPLGPG